MQAGGNTYREGETVIAVVDGERGTVVSVERNNHVRVQFANCDALFPLDTQAIRKLYPWETI